MFGSLSNWVNENVPKPTMPTMPNVNMPTVNMPTVSMPNMPNMPGFLNKNKDASKAEEGVENDQVATSSDGATTDPVNVDQVKVENLEEEAEAKQVSGEETKVTEEDGVSRASDETAESASYKTLESAKEMTKNMGSEFLDWCSLIYLFFLQIYSKI